ncbi:MAG TPA: DUF3570 domain-containing protein [Gammaproteobacteria bacterium]|nr:DUF3570 domain-containing protein [Gammaproteobacteria bacterium]
MKQDKGTILWLLVSLIFSRSLLAAVLPEDRADLLYHSYNGGGVQVTGPSILVRKSIGNSISASANYYVDAISSASIDVVTTASPYKEKRTETSASVDYLHADTIMGLSYTRSSENDYQAKTAAFNISQELFGNMMTVSLGYVLGNDVVGKRGDPSFSKDVNRQQYRVGLSQILTRNLLLDLGFETVADEGYLNNPYRSVRYLDTGSAKGYSYEPEKYPRTRTSNAMAVRFLYHLPIRASIHGEYRLFDDSWGITANHIQLGYTHTYRNNWIFDLKYRVYTQTRADFYADLFPYSQSQNFYGRDKEISAFSSQTFGVGVSYDFVHNWRAVDRASLNVKYDYILFDYRNFRDLRDSSKPAGSESLYSFSANVLQLYLSVWY